MWPPGLSQPFPMLLNQSASPSSAGTEAAELPSELMGRARDAATMLWGANLAVVTKGAPVPSSVGSDSGLDTFC